MGGVEFVIGVWRLATYGSSGLVAALSYSSMGLWLRSGLARGGAGALAGYWRVWRSEP